MRNLGLNRAGLAGAATALALLTAPAAFARSNGPIVFLAGKTDHQQIYTIKPNGTGMRQLTRSGNNQFPAISDNGKLIAFVRVKNSTTAVVDEMSSTGTHLHALTSISAEFEGEHLSFSPNGKEIAFTNAGTSTIGGIDLMDADGSHVRQITEHGFNFPEFSPSGKKLLYWAPAADDTEQGVFSMNLNGSGKHAIILNASFYFTDFSVAPSGQLVFDAFEFQQTGTCQGSGGTFSSGNEALGTSSATGSHFSLLTPAGSCDNTEPAFSPDGRDIAFLSDRSAKAQGVYNVFTMTAAGGDPTQVTHFTGGVSSPAW